MRVILDGAPELEVAGEWSLRVELEGLAALLLPDWPIYFVLPDAGLPRKLNVYPDAAGYTGRALYKLFQPWLAAQGHDRGPGAVVVLNMPLGPVPEPRDWEGAIDRAAQVHGILGIAVHELAHVAEVGIDTSDSPLPLPAEVLIAQCRATYEAEARPRADRHTPTFLRIAAHACHRLGLSGHRLHPDAIHYGLDGTPKVSDAVFALADELERLADIPLHELRSHKPPEDYRGIWLFRLNKWRNEQPEQDTEADAIVAAACREPFLDPSRFEEQEDD
jgi:hypothetical protein